MAVSVNREKFSTSRSYSPKLRQEELCFGPAEICQCQHEVGLRVAIAQKRQMYSEVAERTASVRVDHWYKGEGPSVSMEWRVEELAVKSASISDFCGRGSLMLGRLPGAIAGRLRALERAPHVACIFLEDTELVQLLFKAAAEHISKTSGLFGFSFWGQKPGTLFEQEFFERGRRADANGELGPVLEAEPRALAEMAMAQDTQEEATRAALREDKVSYRLVRRDEND